MMQWSIILGDFLEFKPYMTRAHQRTDGPTDRRTDSWTDKASYRDAWTHLKKIPTELNKNIIQIEILEQS